MQRTTISASLRPTSIRRSWRSPGLEATTPRPLETVSPAMRKQWFTETNVNGRQKWQVDDRVKKLITFNELNLMAQWPFKGQFDVIFCRNVVIYFDEPTQMKIWSRLCRHAQSQGSSLYWPFRACLRRCEVGLRQYRHHHLSLHRQTTWRPLMRCCARSCR